MLYDDTAVLLFKLPDPLKERLAPEVPHLDPLFLKLSFNDVLSGDTSVIGSRDPDRCKAAHTVPTGHNVLRNVIEYVTHMEDAGHVWRRHYNTEGLL